MTKEEFIKGWQHFCKCIDFGCSNLDAEAIRFMNEAPAEIAQALSKPRQHYEAIAKIIKKTKPTEAYEKSFGDVGFKTRCQIGENLGTYFASDNAAFDRGKFLKACGLTE